MASGGTACADASSRSALTLNGRTFAKGLGVHALSDVRYNNLRDCTRFRASVGVDDEVA